MIFGVKYDDFKTTMKILHPNAQKKGNDVKGDQNVGRHGRDYFHNILWENRDWDGPYVCIQSNLVYFNGKTSSIYQFIVINVHKVGLSLKVEVYIYILT